MKKMNKFRLNPLAIMCLLMAITYNCEKDNGDLPVLTTSSISNITATSASCGGDITSNGGTTITVRGVCWNIVQAPTTSVSKTIDGSGTGSFNSNISGLTASTLYYIRAYATNKAGTVYGNELSFTTQAVFSCGDAINYEGKTYNTVQIGMQCWLKENLDVGTRIDASQNQSDNGIIEKYCYNNDPDSCTKYGGLYQWNEMMQYIAQQGTQGICPSGWHIPTDEEWKVLEGTVDSQYGNGDPEWDIWGSRGFDAGTNIKTTSGWYANGIGTDLFGFSGLPSGHRDIDSLFSFISYNSIIWTSKGNDNHIEEAWGRAILYNSSEVYRGGGYSKLNGFSVRCLRDE